MLGVSGKYRLDQRLGGGGMAEVFLASTQGAEGFSRRVAIKRVLPGYSDNDAFAGMFIAEAQISSQLVHPNIVSVLDFDRDAENRLFLVMELVEGKDLDALIATGILPVPVVIYVIAEVLRGLGYAHDLPVGTHVRGVVHRDVSPHNVLLSWEGAVKVSDFGIAKARAASEATASVFIKGKPAYMSPEQANGQPLDGRSDLFAVGIMLWEMLVGRRLFVGNDTRATLAAVLFGQVPRPRSLRPDIPKDLERVTMKLLERDLPARYLTAEQAIEDLLECADAPKAGREALTATLAERFPAQAPVRHSQRPRSIPGSRNTPPGSMRTMPDGSPASAAPVLGNAATMPSLGSIRNAPTGTIDHGQRPRRRARTALLAGAVLVVAAFTSFAIVSAVSGRDEAGAGSGSVGQLAAVPPGGSAQAAVAGGAGPAGPPSPDAQPPPPPPDAPPPPPDATPPSDAGVSAGGAGSPGARPGAGATETAKRPEPAKLGKLSVLGPLPTVGVFLNGTKLGETPLTDYPLPVGRHTILLKRLDSEVDYKDRWVPVTIREGKTTEVQK
jgi:serine/threonine-protein kinase